MRDVITHLNYIHVLVVAVAGFLVGWLWFSPVLFAKIWMKEMKYTEEYMKECAKKGLARYFALGFLFTLLGTFGLAALIAAHGAPNWKHGAAFGAFVGVFGPAVRMCNGSIWENRSIKLQAIIVGHEFVLYAVQGAILGAWH